MVTGPASESVLFRRMIISASKESFLEGFFENRARSRLRVTDRGSSLSKSCKFLATPSSWAWRGEVPRKKSSESFARLLFLDTPEFLCPLKIIIPQNFSRVCGVGKSM
jgi:hypothetical protein